MCNRYGQHLSKEAVAALVAPHPDSVDLVESWLQAHGLDVASSERSHAGDWITIRVSVAQAEKMLGTKYNIYRHGKSDEYVVRTMNYNLPNVLHEHVAVVAPTTYFGTMKSMRVTSFVNKNAPTLESDPLLASLTGLTSLATVPSSCSTTITPSCLRALYNTADYVPAATDKNILGVAGYLNEFANRADLQVCTPCQRSAQLCRSRCSRLGGFCCTIPDDDRRSSNSSGPMPPTLRSPRCRSTVAVMTSPTPVWKCVVSRMIVWRTGRC